MTGYLTATPIIDSDHPSILAHAREAAESVDPIDRAVRFFLAVRDRIRYDPYTPFYLPDHYRASFVLERKRAFCVPKASLPRLISTAGKMSCFKPTTLKIENSWSTPKI